MSDPTVIDCSSSCTVTVVHELVFPPLALSLEEGAQIALAIGVVWGLAFCIRQMARLLAIGGASSTSEEN